MMSFWVQLGLGLATTPPSYWLSRKVCAPFEERKAFAAQRPTKSSVADDRRRMQALAKDYRCVDCGGHYSRLIYQRCGPCRALYVERGKVNQREAEQSRAYSLLRELDIHDVGRRLDEKPEVCCQRLAVQAAHIQHAVEKVCGTADYASNALAQSSVSYALDYLNRITDEVRVINHQLQARKHVQGLGDSDGPTFTKVTDQQGNTVLEMQHGPVVRVHPSPVKWEYGR